MPYVRIQEEDINPLASFDTIENAVLIFGFDFDGLNNLNTFIDSENFRIDIDDPAKCKVYTSLKDFKQDLKISGINEDSVDGAAFRPYITAVDCLTNGLPVIYCSLDHCLKIDHSPDENGDYAGSNVIIYATDSETGLPLDGRNELPNGTIGDRRPLEIEKDYILYEFLSAGDYLPAPVVSYDSEWVIDSETSEGSEGSEGHIKWQFDYAADEDSTALYTSYNIPANQAERIYKQFKLNNSLAEDALALLINGGSAQQFGDCPPGMEFVPGRLPQLDDRINMPYTFITTCGFESKVDALQSLIDATGIRLDFLYLYDFAAEVTPKKLLDAAIECSKKQNVTVIHPWGHFGTSFGLKHMPGSYAYLMAYANSIRNNKPWLAVAGINRGIIPNIRAVDWNFAEPYVHALQGDEYYTNNTDNAVSLRVNPIINFGPTFGKIIFGNRTLFTGNGYTALPFRSFLNVRLLLINIHKAAFNSSIQHMFEPNDDIVWLSFKQKVNDLLDKMVSGRGIKWYKWYKLQPDKLGQIKAKLKIRPIEAVESFDITISMTDEDIEVSESEVR